MESGILGFTHIQCTQDGTDHAARPIMQMKEATITINTDVNFSENRMVNGTSSTLLEYVLKREIGHAIGMPTNTNTESIRCRQARNDSGAYYSPKGLSTVDANLLNSNYRRPHQNYIL